MKYTSIQEKAYPLRFKKIISVVVSILFILNQSIPFSYAISSEELEGRSVPIQAEIDVQDKAAKSTEETPVEDSTAFLMINDSPLASTEVAEETEIVDVPRDLPEYSYDEAQAYLTPDYAAAVIVEELSKDDLADLMKKEIEVGLAVIEGKIVIFTSGTEGEIRVNPIVKELLSEAELVAHTHPFGHREEPSLSDILAAGEGDEYLISEAGVYAYNREGVKGEAQAYETLIERIRDLQNLDGSTKATRDILNTFIAEIDAYNENQEEAVLFRSADNTTILPNSPFVAPFATQTPSATVTVNQTAPDYFRMNYDMTSVGSFGGAIINFNKNEGTGLPSTTVDLNVFSDIIFNLATNNFCVNTTCVKIEFVSTQQVGAQPCVEGTCVAAVNISGLGTTLQEIKLNLANLRAQNPTVDFSKIKQINFVIDHNMVQGRPIGYLDVETGGLNFDPTLTPSGLPASSISPAPLTSDGTQPVLNSFVVQGTMDVELFSSTFARLSYHGNNEASFGAAYLNYDNPNTTGSAEYFNFTEAFPEGLILQLDSPNTGHVNQVIFEMTDATGKYDRVYLSGITNIGQRWLISADDFDLLDPTRISVMTLVFEGLGDQVINLDWGSFEFTPDISSANLPASAITKVPLTSSGERPEILAFNDGNAATTVVVDQTSETFTHIEYDGATTGSFGGVYISYDNPETQSFPAESFDFTEAFPTGLVFQLDSPNATEIIFEVTDNQGVTEKVNLVDITNYGKRWQINADHFDVADMTHIVFMSFVFEGANPATLNVDWGNFAIEPKTEVTQAPVTDFSNERPSVGVMEPCSVINQSPCVTTLNTITDFSLDGPDHFTMDFDLRNGRALGGRLYGGALLLFTAENLDASSGIVLGLSATGTENLRLEFKDVNGYTAVLGVEGLTSDNQNYLASAENLIRAGHPAFDITKIEVIALVIDNVLAGSATAYGTIEVNTQGLAYTTVIRPDGDLSLNDVTPLPTLSNGSRPSPTAFAKDDTSTASVTILDRLQARLTYNGYDDESYGGTFILYDDPTTETNIETINLEEEFPGGIVLGLNGSNVGDVILEVTDIHDVKSTVLLTDIASIRQFYRVQMSDFFDVDMTAIKSIAFVFSGSDALTLDVTWGDFVFIEDIGPDSRLSEVN
ncbi:MAG: hypothetical protein JW893_03405, partial [Candidatus Omnitrophica bacterium]|nr:hypothetical protein [Candidatus Omnitrophota bacterium]